MALESQKRWLIRAWFILVPFVLLLSVLHFLSVFGVYTVNEEYYKIYNNIVLFFGSVWFFSFAAYSHKRNKELKKKG